MEEFLNADKNELRRIIGSILGDNLLIDNIEDLPKDKVDWEWFSHCVKASTAFTDESDYKERGFTSLQIKEIISGERRRRIDLIKWCKFSGSGFETFHVDRRALTKAYNKK